MLRLMCKYIVWDTDRPHRKEPTNPIDLRQENLSQLRQEFSLVISELPSYCACLRHTLTRNSFRISPRSSWPGGLPGGGVAFRAPRAAGAYAS